MAEGLTSPGHDAIVLSFPAGRHLCNSIEHAALGRLAEVIVTFGELGTLWQPGALWPETWGRSYPMCAECWDSTRRVAEIRRPELIIVGALQAQARGQAPAYGA